MVAEEAGTAGVGGVGTTDMGTVLVDISGETPFGGDILTGGGQTTTTAIMAIRRMTMIITVTGRLQPTNTAILSRQVIPNMTAAII